MEKVLKSLFPQGQRKLVVSLIGLALAVVLDKYAGGLSDDMATSIIAIVAIFAGGNVLEHLADALKIIKGTKAWDYIDDYLPPAVTGGQAPSPKEVADADRALDVEEKIIHLQEQIAELRNVNEKNTLTLQQLAQVVSNILNRPPSQGGQGVPRT